MSNTTLDPLEWWPEPLGGPKLIAWAHVAITNACGAGGGKGPKSGPHNCPGMVVRRPAGVDVPCGCPCHFEEPVGEVPV